MNEHETNIEKIISNTERDLNELLLNYKKNRKEILHTKNMKIKTFKEKQSQKLGFLLFDYYNTFDINEVLHNLNLQDKIINK